MSIIRIHKRDTPYVQIDKQCLEDIRLSWKAKGLHTYLISKPDDWTIRIKQLANASREGRDATRAALQELEAAGYITKHQKRGTGNRIVGTEWNVYEKPQTGFPATEKPDSGKPDTTNKRDIPSNDCIVSLLAKENPEMESTPVSQNCESSQDARGTTIAGGGGYAGIKKGGDRKPDTWLTAYDEVWHTAFGGHIPFGQSAKLFKQLESEFGREDTLSGWRKHCEQEFKFASPSYFAKKPHIWISKAPIPKSYTMNNKQRAMLVR